MKSKQALLIQNFDPGIPPFASQINERKQRMKRNKEKIKRELLNLQKTKKDDQHQPKMVMRCRKATRRRYTGSQE